MHISLVPKSTRLEPVLQCALVFLIFPQHHQDWQLRQSNGLGWGRVRVPAWVRGDRIPICSNFEFSQVTFQDGIILRSCDSRNLNMEPLCTLEKGPMPKLWLAQVKSWLRQLSYNNAKVEDIYRWKGPKILPDYIKNITSPKRIRHFDSLVKMEQKVSFQWGAFHSSEGCCHLRCMGGGHCNNKHLLRTGNCDG